MIELTPSARQRLDEYLTELRLALAECGSVDPNEVERDVQDHIQAALGEAAAPVDVPLLDQVLRNIAAATGIGFGLWWLILGQLAWWRPAWVRGLFRPFADQYRGRGGLILSLLGLLVLATGLLLAVV